LDEDYSDARATLGSDESLGYSTPPTIPASSFTTPPSLHSSHPLAAAAARQQSVMKLADALSSSMPPGRSVAGGEAFQTGQIAASHVAVCSSGQSPTNVR